MINQDLTELITTQTHEVSNFSFISSPQCQKALSKSTPEGLQILFNEFPSDRVRFIHEIWRIGKLRTLYDFLTMVIDLPGQKEPVSIYRNYLEDELIRDDLVFNTAAMINKGGVSEIEGCIFLRDVLAVSANARDNQEYGAEPLDMEAFKTDLSQSIERVAQTKEQMP